MLTIQVWDVLRGDKVGSLSGHENRVSCLGVSNGRHQFVYWILGFYGKSPIISVLYHRHTNFLNSSRSGRDKTVRNQDTPIFRNVIFQRLSFLIFFFLISDPRV